MAKVPSYSTRAEALRFVDRFPFREHSPWNHHGFLPSPEGL
jgi:hypothetical protein